MRYTYSHWDGTQSHEGIEPDELMEALADGLMSGADVESALHDVRWSGLHRGDTQTAAGLMSLLEELRSRRQSELDRYNLDSILDDIRERVQDVIRTEREGIERRIEESADDPVHGELLRSIAERKKETLEGLSPEPGSAVTSLSEYEFLDDQAREMFQALMEMLERHVLQRHFRSMEELLRRLSGEEVESVKSMLRDLKSLLRDRQETGIGQVDDFIRQHGQYFPGASSVSELVEQMQEQASHTEALMASMSPEMRRTLDKMMASILTDHELREELSQIAEILQSLALPHVPCRNYPFSGENAISLEEAMRLMRRMHDLDELERSMKRSHETGDLQLIDDAQVQRVLGEASHRAVEQLKGLPEILERAGYIRRAGTSIELTARGIRKIGLRALSDIFSHLQHDTFGEHALSRRGSGSDRSEDTGPYEYGNPFLLNLHATLMNAVAHSGSGLPVHVSIEDLEVYGTEDLTRASTVLMLDMSRSMPLRGCFEAAKKVALALNSLIRLQFPRDHLYIVGFSDYARQLRPETLHSATWGDHVYGTNMQHGFMLARRLLARHRSSTKQVILITDGEPTAHVEGGRVHFSYPPTFRTFQETLREVGRCTREGIIINTFMLERSHYLAEFVEQMARINGGRAFFATPERLGDYIVVDYLRNRQKVIT